ncbi:TraB/GumN family protein [Tahibacter amnicola]|uniref:TraB/GumN family protein n=1 Tax=Tahibacter amnicola TaxID=2976241 RepID=A0ABY6BK30_9GAMM|nr:TraB/GumN family protein [Tahibacter amnicola]UXI68951.1 TraB/GumN family protein [Tahibacter amnicola]
MPRHLASCLAFALAALAHMPTNAQQPLPPATESATVVLDQVLVSGEQPGPGMWRVSKGDHVLWILGVQSPLPKKMSWRSKDVEAVIAQSQEVLRLPRVEVGSNIGFLRGLTLLPAAMSARKNPDDATLADILPADTYAHWTRLKAQYLGKSDKTERWRPLFAAQELYEAAIEKRGLSEKGVVWPVVEKLAREHKVPVTVAKIEIPIEEPRKTIKEFARSPLDDADCFAKTLNRLDTDLDAMRERANAWAVGDVAQLRQLTFADNEAACLKAALDTSVSQRLGLDELPARIKKEFLAAADAALARNASTLAVLPMDMLLKSDGYLAALSERNYTIEEPE